MGILAFNILIWLRLFYLPSLYKKHMTKRMRYRLINIPGRAVQNSKGVSLYLMEEHAAIFQEIYHIIMDKKTGRLCFAKGIEALIWKSSPPNIFLFTPIFNLLNPRMNF